MRRRGLFIVFLFLMLTVAAVGQSARLRGKVLDSSGLVMPGAQLRVFQGDKLVKETTSGSTGDFDISIAPGDYRLEVSAPDFQPFRQTVKLTASTAPLTISMKLGAIAQNVSVTEDASKVSTDSDSSLNTM